MKTWDTIQKLFASDIHRITALPCSRFVIKRLGSATRGLRDQIYGLNMIDEAGSLDRSCWFKDKKHMTRTRLEMENLFRYP